MNKSTPVFALLAMVALSIFVLLRTSADADNGRRAAQPCVGCDSPKFVASRDQLTPLHDQIRKEVAVMVAKAEVAHRRSLTGVNAAFAPQLGGRRLSITDELFVAITGKSSSARDIHLAKVIGARLKCVGWDATISKRRSDSSGLVYEIQVSPIIVCDKGQSFLTTFSCTEEWKRVGSNWKMMSCKQSGDKLLFYSL